MGKPLLIKGMHGMGDCLHQRAIIRQLMANDYDVWLETSWVSLYHDLIEQGLKVIHKATTLRTQTKNAKREINLFSKSRPPTNATLLQIRYTAEVVNRNGSVLAGMMASCGPSYGLNYETADFRLPIPQAWYAKADALIDKWQPGDPIMLYRPLVLRREWHFNGRNADASAYAKVYRQELREKYFIVSLADLVPNIEWIVGEPVSADIEFHHGELEFETLAALASRASLVYASPGFAVPLAQAVSTPVICMFGGYENSSSFRAGARYSPYLGIDPIRPCNCFRHNHACDKRMDAAKAIAQTRSFLNEIAGYKKGDDPRLRQMGFPATTQVYEQRRA